MSLKLTLAILDSSQEGPLSGTAFALWLFALLTLGTVLISNPCQAKEEVLESQPSTTPSAWFYLNQSNGESPVASSYFSEQDDQPALFLSNGAIFSTRDIRVRSTGNSSSQNRSVLLGQNAAVLATQAARLDLEGGSIESTGAGGSAVFVGDAGTVVNLSKLGIQTSGTAAQGLGAGPNGALHAEALGVLTTGAQSPALATRHGSGIIAATACSVVTSGTASPAAVTLGTLKLQQCRLEAKQSQGLLIEDSGSVDVIESEITSSLSSAVEFARGTNIGDEPIQGLFAMRGGSLGNTSSSAPLICVRGSVALLHLSGVALSTSSGTLLRVTSDGADLSGRNESRVYCTAETQTLIGDITADASSLLSLTLKKESVLTGSIHHASLTLDSSSLWVVSSDSELSTLDASCRDEAGRIQNIQGKGHDVRYDASLEGNRWLEGKTLTLPGGGRLRPL